MPARGDCHSVVLLMFALALSAGCGGTGPRFTRIHGKVSLDGKPVPLADLHFTPLAEKNPGRSTQLRVIEGDFDSGPTGGVVGKSKLTLEVIDLGNYQIKDPHNLTADENYRIMLGRRQTYSKELQLEEGALTITFLESDKASP